MHGIYTIRNKDRIIGDANQSAEFSALPKSIQKTEWIGIPCINGVSLFGRGGFTGVIPWILRSASSVKQNITSFFGIPCHGFFHPSHNNSWIYLWWSITWVILCHNMYSQWRCCTDDALWCLWCCEWRSDEHSLAELGLDWDDHGRF